MKKLIVLTIIFILTCVTNPTICFGSDINSSLNGSVWTDSNANGVQEPEEGNMANTTILIKDMATGDVVTNETDAQGYFSIDTLPHGEYTIWSEKANGAVTNAQIITLDEVGGTAILDIIFEQDDLVGQSATPFNIFLPLINS